MEDNEEIFTTVVINITWEEIQDTLAFDLKLDSWPSKEEITEILVNLGSYKNGVEEFIEDLEDTILRLKNEELPRRINAWTKGREKRIKEILDW